jgi:hypothetical protein
MTEQETLKEFKRLANLYHVRKREFAKASRTRWILTFVGFVLLFVFILIKGDIEYFFQIDSFDDIKNTLAMIFVAIMFTGIYFFINVSVFGWLFQKNISEWRRLDNIEKEILELEKQLKQLDNNT